MDKYVLGFVFDKQDRILLIKKNRPAFQKGKLNGLGGKVEYKDTLYKEMENPVQAMKRESYEEANLRVDWVEYGVMYGINYGNHFECFLLCARTVNLVH